MSDSWSTAKWFKIVCLDCGSNCDLLQDFNHRVICRECLDKNEFNEFNEFNEVCCEIECEEHTA